MRTLLVTGPGGAGTSTVAAATALAAARDGHRTLLITPGRPAGPPDLDGVPGLRVHTVDSNRVFTDRAAELQDRFGMLFDLLGANPLDQEEFTELPGADAFALLQALGTARGQDVVVADLPSLPRSLALLALPGQLRRYLTRLLPAERQAARALRPLIAQLTGVPMPAEWLYDTAARWDAELAAVQAVVVAASTAVRLVADPGPRATAAVRTARTALALHGLRLESVVANRLLPTGSADPFYGPLADRQHDGLAALRAEADDAGAALHRAPHLGAEPDGAEALARLAVPAPAPWTGGDGPAPDPWTVEDRLAEEGHLIWRLPLPCATRDGLDLIRRGDELVVDAAGFRHIMPLPAALRRCTVEGAALRDGALQVRFAPDPALWPR
ncbi:ArsA-related P-loop ATPase [Streptomyces sp. SL13]|uniref:ArsA-related P-loop ATPase n=1 Tax=Streptantibioticus silvisoli TaxID=2705255 RepID=A0AA90H177_9ACTN|nr:ArsA-related P-loop ATPase [Streptantibioticus silvisoli]MDI5970206.1 ArsA-related P-loop ATPase [Streptantibioticus silvisoli]